MSRVGEGTVCEDDEYNERVTQKGRFAFTREAPKEVSFRTMIAT